MLGAVHVLVGALIGVSLRKPEAVLPIAFFSHYVLDFIPHIDSETFSIRHPHYSQLERFILATDVLAVISLTGIFFTTSPNWPVILLGTCAAQLPDWLVPLERYSFFHPFKTLHQLCHWDIRRAHRWSWFITGLVSPLLLIIMCSLLLFPARNVFNSDSQNVGSLLPNSRHSTKP